MSAAWPCPACNHDNEGHINAAGLPMVERPGDVSFCEECHVLLVFVTGPVGQVIQRLPTPREYLELLADPRIADVRDRLDRADGLR